ncbi:MAG TPA: MBL fold metallo-hydrolase [Bryobacteraceae bacterium]|nr:MBL fold metallo-hydrolase [Bryobacteraceae bacterium]
MRRTLVVVVFSALAVLAMLSAQRAPESLVHELGQGVFYWQGDEILRVQTNVGWAIFKDYVFVMDANFPWGAREILPAIGKTSERPIRFVFNTHYHADHSYGNVIFQRIGAAIVSSMASSEESRAKGWRDIQNQAKERATEPQVHPSVLFPDKMVLDDGEQRVELTKVGPAHTRGDSVAYLPKSKVLFVGDLAVNWVYGNNLSDPDADYHNWISVLDRLSAWDVKVVVPGHGVPGTMEIIRGQRDYLRDMLQAVESGIKAGKTADQLAQEINLTRYQPFGADPKRTAGQVRSMYRKLAAGLAR